jgi:hypothetical protein
MLSHLENNFKPKCINCIYKLAKSLIGDDTPIFCSIKCAKLYAIRTTDAKYKWCQYCSEWISKQEDHDQIHFPEGK